MSARQRVQAASWAAVEVDEFLIGSDETKRRRWVEKIESLTLAGRLRLAMRQGGPYVAREGETFEANMVDLPGQVSEHPGHREKG